DGGGGRADDLAGAIQPDQLKRRLDQLRLVRDRQPVDLNLVPVARQVPVQIDLRRGRVTQEVSRPRHRSRRRAPRQQADGGEPGDEGVERPGHRVLSSRSGPGLFGGYHITFPVVAACLEDPLDRVQFLETRYEWTVSAVASPGRR